MDKLIFLGLDGVGWNVINKMIEDGKLNNFKKLINEGSSSILRADEPLISPKIWTSMYTGKKPEKHGIIDFYSDKQDLQAEQIWDILHDNNFKTGVYRPLGGWNLIKDEGFFIPSFLSFEKESYPKKLSVISELDQKAREDKEKSLSPFQMVKNFWKFIKVGFPLSSLFKIIKQTIPLFYKRNFKIRLYIMKSIEFTIHTSFFFKLIKKYNTDFSTMYENSCDSLSHKFWGDYERKSQYLDILPNMYQKIDTYLGKLIKYAENNKIHLLVVSDHGFTTIGDLLTERGAISINVEGLLKELDLDNDVYGVNLAISSVFRIKPNSKLSFDELKRIFESITCDNKKLFELEDIGQRIVIKINYFFGQDRELSVQFQNGKSTKLDIIIEFDSDNTGTHSVDDGIFIISGPKIKKGIKLEEVKPYDLTPTILALLDVSIPSKVDGRVLEEIFINPPKIEFFNEEEKEKKKGKGLSDEEEDVIKDRLRSLGYL